MTTFMYDFSNGKTITNPLDGVTHFYVSPYDLVNIWNSLNLKEKVDDVHDLYIEKSTGLPLYIIPISFLNLGRCTIRINDDMSGGKINTGKRSLYFTESLLDHVICITGVH